MKPKVNTFYYIQHKVGPNGEIEINMRYIIRGLCTCKFEESQVFIFFNLKNQSLNKNKIN